MEKLNIITFVNNKGGVSKTTTVTSISSALANKGFKVLVIDLDPQANLTSSFGITDVAVNSYTVLKGITPLIPLRIYENLDILPSTIDLSAFDIEMAQEIAKEYILSDALESLKHTYNYILIDCGPNINLLLLNALAASNMYIIPLLPHYLSLQGLSKLIEIADKVKKRINPNLELGGVVLTQFNSRKILHQDTVASIHAYFNDSLFKTFIRENIALAEAPSTGKDIFRYAPHSNGAIDYLALTEEIIQLKK